jgi:hypothetical protein
MEVFGSPAIGKDTGVHAIFRQAPSVEPAPALPEVTASLSPQTLGVEGGNPSLLDALKMSPAYQHERARADFQVRENA